MIDRDKDKDKDKDKEKEEKDKEKGRTSSVLKTGLSETKENVKKLIHGGKDKSSKSSSSTLTTSTQQQQQPPATPVPLQSNAVHQTSLEYDNHQNSNNGDLIKNSPMVLKRADINNSENVTMDMNMTTFNDKSLPDIVNMSKIDSNGSHGILSPFESMDDSDSEGGIEPIEHQQLSSSSSASINILMDTSNNNNNNNNKILGTNVQVSQV